MARAGHVVSLPEDCGIIISLQHALTTSHQVTMDKVG
jgi:hypothetical protein